MQKASITGIKETCLSVTDVPSSASFYTKVLGFRILQEESRFCAMSVADSHVLLLFARGQTATPVQLPGGLVPPHDASGQQHVGFAISTEDVHAWREHLTEQQIAIESIVTWPRGGTSIYFRDLDGHLLELLTPGVWEIY
jgi:catechol 2,3-dioxygenase-like lactoylglutathione lyase family enzyme